jgi:hypothetical protein
VNECILKLKENLPQFEEMMRKTVKAFFCSLESVFPVTIERREKFISRAQDISDIALKELQN